jgi:tRNA(Ile)-lysidine synthase
METFGGFEPHPKLAVAVSGGADSMALLHLAHAWCAERGGEVLALTVDHRLRPESATEAETVGIWLAKMGVPHRILVREGPVPETGVEAAARAARHALLEEACREAGFLHLLYAHHAGDQRETVTMRVARGPGRGAAGMAALDWRRQVRILRPLLGVERADLEAFDRARAQPWIDDPSNASDRYERNRVRRRLASAPSGILDELDRGIALAQSARATEQRMSAQRIQAWVRLSPQGAAWVDARAWDGGEGDLDLLARLLRCIGGRVYPPGRDALARARAALMRGNGFSLGGCVVRPQRGGGWFVRERRGAAAGRRACVRGGAFDPAGGEFPLPSAVLAALSPDKGIDGICASPSVGYDPGGARFTSPPGVTACAAWLAPFGASLMY